MCARVFWSAGTTTADGNAMRRESLSLMVRAGREKYQALKLRAHELLRDVPLYDVSVVDLSGGGDGRTLTDVLHLQRLRRGIWSNARSTECVTRSGVLQDTPRAQFPLPKRMRPATPGNSDAC